MALLPAGLSVLSTTTAGLASGSTPRLWTQAAWPTPGLGLRSMHTIRCPLLLEVGRAGNVKWLVAAMGVGRQPRRQ